VQQGAKFIAAERGVFEPVEAEAEVIPQLATVPLVQRLTDDEVVMLYEFRKSLPVMA
jgi:hypothetical protein